MNLKINPCFLLGQTNTYNEGKFWSITREKIKVFSLTKAHEKQVVAEKINIVSKKDEIISGLTPTLQQF